MTMNYLWDTNLLVHFIRNSITYQDLNNRLSFLKEEIKFLFP